MPGPQGRHNTSSFTAVCENTIAQIANAVGGLGSAMWNFSALMLSLLPNLGVRAANFLALIAIHRTLHFFSAWVGRFPCAYHTNRYDWFPVP